MEQVQDRRQLGPLEKVSPDEAALPALGQAESVQQAPPEHLRESTLPAISGELAPAIAQAALRIAHKRISAALAAGELENAAAAEKRMLGDMASGPLDIAGLEERLKPLGVLPCDIQEAVLQLTTVQTLKKHHQDELQQRAEELGLPMNSFLARIEIEDALCGLLEKLDETDLPNEVRRMLLGSEKELLMNSVIRKSGCRELYRDCTSWHQKWLPFASTKVKDQKTYTLIPERLEKLGSPALEELKGICETYGFKIVLPKAKDILDFLLIR